jgi:fatty-acyl-CoA synthase
VCVEDLIAWCASGLAKFKVPKYVRVVTDFPLTASGKIQKYKLREEHQKQLTTQNSELRTQNPELKTKN